MSPKQLRSLEKWLKKSLPHSDTAYPVFAATESYIEDPDDEISSLVDMIEQEGA